ncbi:Gfo/Idh/MocA family oxidoreductase [Bacteroidales bacterium]|nr:Gfo/Idh/MocA family oxidoreductase [Bacteroidales bacterium]
MEKLKGVAVGAGYFSFFQYEAWNRLPNVEITAFCNRDEDRAQTIIKDYGITKHYADYVEMLNTEKPDFVDIITPPGTHLSMCKEAADRGIHIICQKPLAPTIEEAKEIVAYCESKNVRFMVHENWRFQPWHREIKKLIDNDTIGKVHYMNFRSRMGDGWGENAYIPRQPYFRDYPKLLIYETGIHFIDTFRYLNGDIKRVFSMLRRLNPVIKGEDSGIVNFEFENGAIGQWDANRYNEPNYASPRYTFGEFLVEGTNGSIRLYSDGKITVHKLGEKELEHVYEHKNINFAGDCVYNTQKHFIDNLISGEIFETNGDEYLKSLHVQDRVYESYSTKEPVKI